MSASVSPLTLLYSRFEQVWQKQGYPEVEFDPQWPSPCVLQNNGDGTASWKPSMQQPKADFAGIEQALELNLHPSIKAYYGEYFAQTIAVRFADERFELVQAWNEQDLEQLKENMIGHLLMQRRLKQAESVFIASCEDDMKVLSVLNNTGEVVVEKLGKGIEKKLAEDLASFIEQVELA